MESLKMFYYTDINKTSTKKKLVQLSCFRIIGGLEFILDTRIYKKGFI